MPRRHNRDSLEHAPLGIATEPPPPAPRTWQEIKADMEKAAERSRQRTEARRIQRIADAIDWHNGCLVPGCQEQIFTIGHMAKDPEWRLPLCVHHEIIVWRTVQRSKGDLTYIDEINRTEARVALNDERAHEAQKQAWRAKQDGHIYFLRLNGLIKVGWTRCLPERLKAYGPDVEVLCHYPATRQDETLMHRQLRPYLAKGREWYQDCKLIEDVVARLLAEHGPPNTTAEWTQPKAIIKPRRRSA